MMKLTYFKALILLLSLSPLVTLAQNAPQKKPDSVLLLIKKYINEKNTSLIYSLTNKGYQAAVPENGLHQFFVNSIYPLGKITTASFVSSKYDLNKYKLEFERGTLVFIFPLDQDDRLTKFTFLPFKPDVGPVPTSNLLKSKIDKQVDSVIVPYLDNANAVGLSIGILKDGKIHTYGYGTTQKKEGKLPDANTIFEIGSITKTFTASILAWYVNKGKISLTDPITKYLPDSLAANPELQKISILNLSNHTSGLSRMPGNIAYKGIDNANPYKGYTQQMLFADLKKVKLNAVPGEVYAYSNLGTGLLGVILEKISGKTYETLVKEIITKPLKMTRTFQQLTPEWSGHFVRVYTAEAMETKAWDFDALAGCGALKSTVNDLLIYAGNNIETRNADLSKAFNLSHEVTFSKEQMIGLGWHLLQEKGEVYYWHNGGTGGSRSFLAFNVKKKTAIVLLSNSAAELDGVAREALEKILN